MKVDNIGNIITYTVEPLLKTAPYERPTPDDRRHFNCMLLYIYTKLNPS
jgi:hypothetical protein